jgi:hypothetical protein
MHDSTNKIITIRATTNRVSLVCLLRQQDARGPWP